MVCISYLEWAVLVVRREPLELLLVPERDQDFLVRVGIMVQNGMVASLGEDGGHLELRLVDCMLVLGRHVAESMNHQCAKRDA